MTIAPKGFKTWRPAHLAISIYFISTPDASLVDADPTKLRTWCQLPTFPAATPIAASSACNVLVSGHCGAALSWCLGKLSMSG